MALVTGLVTSSAQLKADSTDSETLTADETARQLANPTAPLGRVTLQFQRWLYEGNLPDASRMSNYAIAFETSLPFPVGNGSNIRFRPTIPLHFRYPVFEASAQKTEFKSGLADITFDLAYGKEHPSGFLLAIGIAVTLPTATVEELGGGRFTLGPEILVGIRPKWGLLGIFPNHEWKISGDGPFSRTIIQPIVTLLPGRGWSIGSSPNLSYDWIGNQWSVPWVLNLGKTSTFNSSTWNFSMEINYYGKKDDIVAPEWMMGINVTKVVRNWFLDFF